MILKLLHLIIALVLLLTQNLFGQLPKDHELSVMLAEKDSILFDAAFNNCDTATIEALFTEDFEFFHDKSGFTAGRTEFLEPIKAQCASMPEGSPQPAKRILIPGSLEVYPMYDRGELYGAIQHGIHRFEFLNEENQYQRGDIARFTHVWVREADTWRIKRELSYDHKLQEEPVKAGG